ncbi:hypothetical protein ACOJCM_01440 [Billgrantia sp. LNSP4103-1]|uniref:hypothetical protein n=1 Tax=Billgrantia sp. LNSP4103-1 TaxID=3410266 RepID=UPI00403F5796
MKAHASLIKAPAILNDVRELIASQISERTVSISAIKESVSAIEAFMNELGELGYGYESHGHKSTNPTPEGRIVLLGKSLRQAESDRKSIKAKVQIAYQSLTSKKLAKVNSPAYQRFSLVVDIRNELVHPKASVLKFTDEGILLPKNEQKIIVRLKSNGFSPVEENYHDWSSIVSNRKFALWAYQAIVDIMIFLFQFWPHKHAVDSYHQMYGLNLREISAWA